MEDEAEMKDQHDVLLNYVFRRGKKRSDPPSNTDDENPSVANPEEEPASSSPLPKKRAKRVDVPWSHRVAAISRLKEEHQEEHLRLATDDCPENKWTGPRQGEHKLGAWIQRTRALRHSSKLSLEKIAELTEVGFPWACPDYESRRSTNADKAYRKENRKSIRLAAMPELCSDPTACNCGDCKIADSGFSTIPDAADVFHFVNSYFLDELLALREDIKLTASEWYKTVTQAHYRKRFRRVVCRSSFSKYVKRVRDRNGMMLEPIDLIAPGAQPQLGLKNETTIYYDVCRAHLTNENYTVEKLCRTAKAMNAGKKLPNGKEFIASNQWSVFPPYLCYFNLFY